MPCHIIVIVDLFFRLLPVPFGETNVEGINMKVNGVFPVFSGENPVLYIYAVWPDMQWWATK